MRHGLIDEYRLTVHSVALGEGLPLTHGLPEPQRLERASSPAYADGCVSQAFRACSSEALQRKLVREPGQSRVGHSARSPRTS